MKPSIRTACTRHCGDGCSLLVSRAEDGTLSVRGNPDHPFTKGFLCAKTARFGERLMSPRRIVTPLIRGGGPGSGYREASWEEALALVAGEIQRLRPTPERMLHVHYFASFGLLHLASRLLFQTLGASGFSGSPCLAAGAEAIKRDFGVVRQGPLTEAVRAPRLVNWGRNAAAQSVHLAAMITQARKKGARVLSVHPGDPGYADLSDHQIVIRPGTDRFLAAAAAKILLERRVASRGALERCANAEEYISLLESMSLPGLLEACGATMEQAGMLAAWYFGEEPTATFIGRGLQRYAFGGENVRFIDALAMISGNVGRPGAGVYYKQGDLGAAAWNWTQAKPGYSRQFPISSLALAVEAADPPVEFVWVEGFNPVTQGPESLATRRMLEERFTVVVEPFLNDTARCATVVLPPALMFECEDMAKNDSHEFINYSAKVMEPRGDCLPNFEIASRLGALLAPPVAYPSPEEVMEAALRNGKVKASLEELRDKGFLGVDVPETPWSDGVFAHPDGLYRLPQELHPEALDDRFPLRLLTPVRQDHLLSQIPEDEQETPPRVFVAPERAEILGLAGSDTTAGVAAGLSGQENRSSTSSRDDASVDGRADGGKGPSRGVPALLETALGSMEVVVDVLEGLNPDTVLYPRGDWLSRGGCVNRLIRGRAADMGGQTAYYEERARLVRA